MFRTLKAIFFWGYTRTTWQYDVLCVLILVFIFLAPKTWFANSERRTASQHQSMSIPSTLLVSADIIKPGMGRDEVETRVRNLTQRTDLTVVDVRPQRDARGEIVAFQVDIR
jgi:hypothetical protein